MEGRYGSFEWKEVIDGYHATVFIDHKLLVREFHSTKPRMSDKQQKHLVFIKEYITDVVHIAAKDSVVADSLLSLIHI